MINTVCMKFNQDPSKAVVKKLARNSKGVFAIIGCPVEGCTKERRVKIKHATPSWDSSGLNEHVKHHFEKRKSGEKSNLKNLKNLEVIQLILFFRNFGISS